METLGKVKALLLDMDGTLVDFDAAAARAWQRWSAEWDVDPQAAFAMMHGAPAAATVRKLRPDLTEAQVAVAAAQHDRWCATC